jgi:hypothetical protein
MCVQYLFSRMWCCSCDNVEKYGSAGEVTDDNIIQRTRFERWIIMATNTLRVFTIYSFSTATTVMRRRLSLTLYVAV